MTSDCMTRTMSIFAVHTYKKWTLLEARGILLLSLFVRIAIILLLFRANAMQLFSFTFDGEKKYTERERDRE